MFQLSDGYEVIYFKHVEDIEKYLNDVADESYKKEVIAWAISDDSDEFVISSGGIDDVWTYTNDEDEDDDPYFL